MATPELILASTSRYRAELLSRLGIAFDALAPNVDESVRADETPEALAVRLAKSKAHAVAAHHPQALVLGSDQVAELDGRALGKPGTLAAAAVQLRLCAGRSVAFHTAISLICVDRDLHLQHCDRTVVRLRELADDEIGRYLEREAALDCAGSFKVEGLGIALFEFVRSEDPTALIGLPLIALARLLRAAGHRLP